MNAERATQWGSWLAHYFSTRGKNNPFLLAAKFGWRVIIENDDDTSPCVPSPMAEWDGSRRTIRLFVVTLRRHLGNSAIVLHHACAHELFHGLVAANYRLLPLPATRVPQLNVREEEIAARAFSEALLNSQMKERACPLSVSR